MSNLSSNTNPRGEAPAAAYDFLSAEQVADVFTTDTGVQVTGHMEHERRDDYVYGTLYTERGHVDYEQRASGFHNRLDFGYDISAPGAVVA